MPEDLSTHLKSILELISLGSAVNLDSPCSDSALLQDTLSGAAWRSCARALNVVQRKRPSLARA